MTPAASQSAALGGVILVEDAAASGGRAAPGLIDAAELTAELLQAGLEVATFRMAAGVSAPAREAEDGGGATRLTAAVERLARRCGAHADRIVVVASRAAAQQALPALGREARIRGAVLVAAPCDPATQDLLADWTEVAVLCVANPTEKSSLRDLVAVYLASAHPLSRLMVAGQPDLGALGAAEPLAPAVARWVRTVLASLTDTTEATMESADGWRLFGNLRIPDGGGDTVPGAVLLHSGRSDRFALLDLERLLASSGFAVLNLDWRGRGRSINKGTYFALSAADRRAGSLDAAAAIDFLAGRREVDAERIALIGVVHGAEHAVRAAVDDPRVKALVLLTGYMPHDERERAHLVGGQVAVLYVSCTGHRAVTAAMRQLHEASPEGRSRLLTYEGGAIGYQLLELDERLGSDIATWLHEALAPRTAESIAAVDPPVAPVAGVAKGPSRQVSAFRSAMSPVAAPSRFLAADGWDIGGRFYVAPSPTTPAAAVLVPGAKHEQDAYGPDVVSALQAGGMAVLAIDVRGRGESAGTRRFSDMAPGERLDVRLDVAAAIDHAAATVASGGAPVCVIAEQDTAAAALLACAAGDRVSAICVLSPRIARSVGRIANAIRVPLLCIASREDRRGLRDALDLYLDSADPRSRFSLLDGAGIGTTMLSTWRFEHPDQPPLEQAVASWLADAAARGGEPAETSGAAVR